MPPLKIHVWGGLGSQLFAIALAADLRLKYPKRKIKIVLHTGGVTYRVPEVVELFPEWDYEYVSDFEVSLHGPLKIQINRFSSIRHRLADLTKKFAIATRVLANCNDDFQYSQIRFWTLACRGHYSHRLIAGSFYDMLANALQVPGDNDLNGFIHSIGIHYRLGDLLTLEQKSPVPIESILSECERVMKARDLNSLVIFSDSPEIARRAFNVLRYSNITISNFNTLGVISSAIFSNYFLGTSSKVSFWVAAIRSKKLMLESSLPASNQAQMKIMLGQAVNLVHFYD